MSSNTLKLFALACLPLSLSAGQFLPFASLDIRSGNASLYGAPASGIISGQALVLPAYQFNESDNVSLMGLINSSGTDKIIAEDGFFVQRSLAMLKPSWRHSFGATKSQVRGAAMRSLMLENPGQAWGSNPYDNEEFSGGLSFSRDFTMWAKESSASLSADYVKRGYPNYRDLTSGLNGNKNEATKDYMGPKAAFELKQKTSEAFNWRLNLGYQLKGYTDGYVQSADTGQVDTGIPRSDSLLSLALEGNAAVLGGQLGLLLEAQSNLSNQNYFDVAAVKGVPDYYSYNSVAFSPGWLQPLGDPKEGHSVRLGAEASLRSFSGRLARSADGKYLADKQTDIETALTGGLRFTLLPHVAAVGGAALRNVNSNNKYDLGSRNSYTLVNLSLGLEFRL